MKWLFSMDPKRYLFLTKDFTEQMGPQVISEPNVFLKLGLMSNFVRVHSSRDKVMGKREFSKCRKN